MTINLQISDTVYRRLLAGHGRIQGTIGLVSPTEGNFNEHVRQAPVPGTKYIKLRHGRASVGGERVRLTLSIGLDEAGVVPSDAITDESRQASDFVDSALDTYNPQIQISAESETKRSIFREKDKTKRSKKESAQHSKSRNKSFVMTSVSAL